jgi:hypothetical protein
MCYLKFECMDISEYLLDIKQGQGQGKSGFTTTSKSQWGTSILIVI